MSDFLVLNKRCKLPTLISHWPHFRKVILSNFLDDEETVSVCFIRWVHHTLLFLFFVLFRSKAVFSCSGAWAAEILVTLFSPFKITLYGCFSSQADEIQMNNLGNLLSLYLSDREISETHSARRGHHRTGLDSRITAELICKLLTL